MDEKLSWSLLSACSLLEVWLSTSSMNPVLLLMVLLLKVLLLVVLLIMILHVDTAVTSLISGQTFNNKHVAPPT